MKPKPDIAMMTNRELFTMYEESKGRKHSVVCYAVLEEMAKRINRKMITPDIASIFRQYKLNGAGDQRY